MSRKSLIGRWCAAGVLLAGVGAPAAGEDPAFARALAATCFTCHGTDGRSVGGIPPSIAGQNKDYLLKVMKDFKAGTRPSTVMGQQAKGYSDAQLELIAAYFASIKPGPAAPAPAARGGK